MNNFPIFTVEEFRIDNQVTKDHPDYKVTLISEMHSCAPGDIVVRRSTTAPRWYVTGVAGDKISIVPMGQHLPMDMLGTWAVRQNTLKEN